MSEVKSTLVFSVEGINKVKIVLFKQLYTKLIVIIPNTTLFYNSICLFNMFKHKMSVENLVEAAGSIKLSNCSPGIVSPPQGQTPPHCSTTLPRTGCLTPCRWKLNSCWPK